MDAETLHELTAAYVLDALDGAELEAFEVHLQHCERCRDEVAELASPAAALAYGAPAVTLPSALRERILEAVHEERAAVVSIRPRWALPVAALAAVAACAAIALGAFDLSLHDQLSREQTQALRSVPITGAHGSVVVADGGSGALLLSDLRAAPAGRTYEAWVVNGVSATPAGLFQGGTSTTVVALSRPLPRGARVAVTLEPAGGSRAPTGKPFIVSRPV